MKYLDSNDANRSAKGSVSIGMRLSWKNSQSWVRTWEKFPETNVTNNYKILTGKIAWVHLIEFPDYYSRLTKDDESGILVPF